MAKIIKPMIAQSHAALTVTINELHRDVYLHLGEVVTRIRSRTSRQATSYQQD